MRVIQYLFKTEGWRDDPVLDEDMDNKKCFTTRPLGDDDGVLMKAAATATTQGKQRETDW